MNKLLANGGNSPVCQVLRWKNDRVKIGGQKTVTFKELYEDYQMWVSKCMGQYILKKTSFTYYFYIVFREEIDNSLILKRKKHPVTFLNLEIADSVHINEN